MAERDWSLNDTAAAIGLHRSTLQQLLKRERLRWDAADNVAVALGRHPCELWPTWFDLPGGTHDSVGEAAHGQSYLRNTYLRSVRTGV